MTQLIIFVSNKKLDYMATLSFKLRNASGKEASIQLFFNYGTGKRFRYSTSLKVLDAKNWDKKKMRVKNVLSEVNKDSINSKLDEVQSIFNKQYTELANTKQEMTNDALRNIADELFNKTKEEGIKEKKDLLPFFEWYLEYYSRNPLPITGRPLAEGTMKTYNNTLTKLKKFNKEVYKLSFKNITLSFHEDFLAWLYESNYSTNYIGTIVKILKTIMNAAFERGLHDNMDFTKRAFIKPAEDVNNIYLNQLELKQFKEADLSSFNFLITTSGIRINRKKLERARDLFLISAYTGLRVQDFTRLSVENFIAQNGATYLVIETQKTKKTVAIPLHPVVKEILKKRDGNPPEGMPNQHVNYALKKIGEIAGIDENFKKTITKAGKRISTYQKKYKLITNHTGRRSFCTNAYLSGMATVDIMAISGHGSEKIFYKYIKADHLQKAAKISQHPFFQ